MFALKMKGSCRCVEGEVRWSGKDEVRWAAEGAVRFVE